MHADRRTDRQMQGHNVFVNANAPKNEKYEVYLPDLRI
jgi:hypothetical protein